MGIDYHFNSLNSARLPILIERGEERERKGRTLKFPGTGHVIRVFWQLLGEKRKKERKNARKRACFVFRARFEDVLVALDQVSPRSGYF